MHSCMENWRVSGAHKLNLHRSVAHRGLVLAIKQSSLFENGSDGGQSALSAVYTAPYLHQGRSSCDLRSAGMGGGGCERL